MKKALLSVAMAAVISLSATAISSTVVGAVSSNLATPKITKAESVDGGVKISWNKSNGAEKYRVYYKGSKGWTRMVDTTSTSYIDKDVSSGKNYTYTVRCINSSATKFTSGYDSKGKSVKYISAPKISKTENVNGGVKISWNKSNGAEKYRVYYKGSKGWTRMVDTTSTSYIDKDVSSGKNYTYTVRCINSSATKFTSGYDSKGKSVKYISTPKITKAESVDGGVKISWNKSNGAEKYRVYYKGSKGWTRMVDTTSTSYIDKDVSSGKNYTYTVRCINSSATKFTSGYDSKGKSVKYISTPKITKAESVDGGVKISWNKSNGAEKYRVYYKGSKGWTRMVDTTSTSYIDKDVSSGKNYTYTVRCINSSATKFTSGYDSKGKSVKYISAPAEHTHSWQKITKETQVKVVDKEAYTYEEPIYEKQKRAICNDCGADISDNLDHIFDEMKNNSSAKGSYSVKTVNVQVGTKTVTVPEKFHYETKTEVVGRKCTVCGKVEMFSEEHTHTWQNVTKETKVKVVDKEAYTYEEPVYEKHDRTICKVCGADITDNCSEHNKQHALNGEPVSYHNVWVNVQVGTKTVTVPEKSHYETKTEVVGRKCTVCGKVEMFSEEHTHTWQNVTKETKVKVVDKEAYTYEEPIYEKQGRYICKVCGADITENTTAHNKQHALNGEPVSYKTVSVEVQVGTKTVTVPEKFHYETKTEVVGRKCTACGKVEYN
ncbi:MAG: fibronectin type III domain-containing protein [Ruminococcus sp.]